MGSQRPPAPSSPAPTWATLLLAALAWLAMLSGAGAAGAGPCLATLAQGYLDKGQAALDQGQSDAAETAFDKALALDPHSTQARQGLDLAALQRGQALAARLAAYGAQLLKDGRTREARDIWEQALAADGKNQAARQGLASLPQPAPAQGQGPDTGTARPRRLTNGLGMEFRLIPAGDFMMGADQDPKEVAQQGNTEAKWLAAEQPGHRVEITRPYYMQTTLVTQGQWLAVMGNDPSCTRGNERLPVDGVSWLDAQEFIRRLNDRERTTSYRLPTEAEWEYACRAGTTTPFYTGPTISTAQANYNGTQAYGSGRPGDYLRRSTAVKSYPPNPWGLFDMHGNLWQWCADWFDERYYANSPPRDPQGPATGSQRVLRGGSWDHYPWLARSAYRDHAAPGERFNDCGFRVVLAIP